MTATPQLDDGDATLFQPARQLRYSAEGRAALNNAGRHIVARYANRTDGLNSQFIGWDGEGVTDPDGSHRFILWGNSAGVTLRGHNLPTEQCLQVMLRTAAAAPSAIHVIFAGSYDVNMMLKDVPRHHLQYLWEHGVSRWDGYRLEYRKGKMFRVSRDGVTCTLYDVFTFFACSFVKACRQYLGDLPVIDDIEAMKSKRGTFNEADMAAIEGYWQSELRLLVEMCNTLRAHFHAAGFILGQWYGPGALANVVLAKHKIQEHKAVPPEAVIKSSQCAYFGGRFELFRMGRHADRVWQYDINSAYPWAIAQLPDLHGGTWHHVTVDTCTYGGSHDVRRWRRHPEQLPSFAMYHLTYQGELSDQQPQPLPWRHKNGAVFFPTTARGWYWGPEVALAIKRYGSAVTIDEAWVFQQADTANPQPFAFVRDYYDRRLLWKQNGNPAQLALKLALNSLYGKMAQKSGWKEGQKPPRWHQLEWAGWVTSMVRAKLLSAMMQKPHALIACETDALFVTEPLDLLVNEGLGNWSQTEYQEITYLQSGIYYATATDGSSVLSKFRGIDAHTLPYEQVMAYLARADSPKHIAELPPMTVTLTRFKTMGTSLGSPNWRRWITEDRKVAPFKGGGKRRHAFSDVGPANRKGGPQWRCEGCKAKLPASVTLHDTEPAEPREVWQERNRYQLSLTVPDTMHPDDLGPWTPVESSPHKLPWYDDDPSDWWTDAEMFDLAPDEV